MTFPGSVSTVLQHILALHWFYTLLASGQGCLCCFHDTRYSGVSRVKGTQGSKSSEDWGHDVKGEERV